MPSNINVNSVNVDSKDFNSKTNTLVIKDTKDTIYITFNDCAIETLNLEIINSDVVIIENYIGSIKPFNLNINIDENSKLNRLSILVDVSNSVNIKKSINNEGFYQSMQIDLTDHSVASEEDINLIKSEAYALVIDGIYAISNSNKKYITNLNHYESNCESKAQIFAINNDTAHVSIFTDAYIKNKAIGSVTNQEGRIINLSDKCSGIVLPNLHIDENDVEASHSCSVGSLNQEHMYYLQTRGLTQLQARNILIRGYFNPLLENISIEEIKTSIIKVLDKRIG